MIQPPQKTRTAQPHVASPRFGRIDADLAEVDSAILRSRDFLLTLQHPEGYWSGELEADSMLEADYIFLHVLLESGDPGRLQRAFAAAIETGEPKASSAGKPFKRDDGLWKGLSSRAKQRVQGLRRT